MPTKLMIENCSLQYSVKWLICSISLNIIYIYIYIYIVEWVGIFCYREIQHDRFGCFCRGCKEEESHLITKCRSRLILSKCFSPNLHLWLCFSFAFSFSFGFSFSFAFYGISALVGYLILNSLYIYIYIYI